MVEYRMDDDEEEEKTASLWFANQPLAQNIHDILQMNKIFPKKKHLMHFIG